MHTIICTTATMTLVSTFLLGCSTTLPAPPAPPVMGATPYTAEQIRDANPPGTRLVFRVQEGQQDPVAQTMWFVSGDDETAVIESSMQTQDGQLIGEPRRSESRWTELRDHALFPADQTTRSLASRTVAAGTFECWVYTIREEDEEGNRTTRRYYFAYDRPGPPVQLLSDVNGTPVFSMELVRDSRGR